MTMKKIYTTLMVLATLAMTLVSCTKEINNQTDEQVVGKMKTVTVKTDIATRTTLDSNHENIVWSSGDVMKIFNNADTTSYRAPYVAGGDLLVEVPEATTEIYAHYPYFKGNKTGPESVSVYISNSQTQKNPGELNGYNYPMVAKGTVVEETVDNETVYKALISLYPVASALALNIYHSGLEGEESVKSVTITPAAANTKFTGSQVTDLTGDNITYTEAASSEPITVTLTNALALGNTKPTDKQKFDGQIYVCLAKQSYANVKFEIQTTKGTYTITSSETPFDCVNNDFVPVNINLNKADFEEAEAPVDPTAYSWILVKDALAVGDKVVIAAAESDVAMSTEQKTNNRGQIAITKSGNALTANADVQVLEVVSGTANGSFAFKCLNGDQIGKYIAAVSSESNNMHSNSDIDANASWSVSINSSTGVASVVAQGTYTRNVLQHNSSSSLFSCYKSASQADVVFYRASLPSANLSFPEESYSVNIGETFTTPTLTNPYNVPVMYSSSNDNIAIVDENTGEVLIGDVAGTVTITASFAGNSTYSASEASYDIMVIDPNAEIEKGATWTYTFTAKQFSSAGTVTLAEQDWTMAGTGGSYFGYDGTKGQQFGSGSAPYSAVTLTSNFGSLYGIESIAVNASGASSINATLSVKVNGVSYKCENSEAVSLTATATTYTFNTPGELNAGDIVISFANSSSKAIYIKTITVNPEGTVVDPVKLVMSDITCTNSGESENTLTFSWTAVENATGYQVSVDGGNTYGTTQTALTYTLTGLSAGTTYSIKVKAIGDGTNYVDSDAKTGTGATKSSQSGDDVYSLYSGDLTEGDYVIVYEGGAMKSSVTSDRLDYSAVTITSNSITGPAENLVWHIAQSGDNWTIYNAEVAKYAASTGAKNKAQLLESGTDNKSLWTVTVGDGTYDFVNVANTSAKVNANLRRNGTYGFACYASTTGGALSLYKKN